MPKKGTLSASDIEKQAIEIVKFEKSTWEDATAFITERVAFQMRNLIRTLRKNFWGVFDVEKDPTTGRKKIWIPLTESFVDSVVKNIDLDTKDINFRAKHAKAIGLTSIVRSIVRNGLDKINFGEYLDEFEKTLAIDGTAVWKTLEEKDEDGEKCVKILPVDLLNIYIDPTSRSIQEAYRFTERSLLTQDQVRMQDWMNKDVVPSVGLNPTDSNYGTLNHGTSKFVDVYEMWGKIPKSLITGKVADEDTEVNGHVVVSGLDRSGQEKVHLIETYDGIKPYEEAWYSRVPGRWYGRGVAEKLLMLQLWVNTVVNIRVNRATISQLGIFKIRKGAGVTPQMLSRLASGGAVVVNNMDDLEQFTMQEASSSSYKDEDVILNWARQTTSNYETVTGEALPASTPATNAALQSRSASSQFVLIKEQIGMFLQRWVKRQYLPKRLSYVKIGDLIRMGLEADALQELDEHLVNAELYNQITSLNDAGLFLDPNQVEMERQAAMAKMSAYGKDRFVKLLHNFDPTEYDVQVYVTNEEMDVGVMTDKLTAQLQQLPALAATGIDAAGLAVEIMRESWDLMGLDGSRIKKPSANPMMGMNPQAVMNSTGMMTQPGGNAPVMGQAKQMTDLVTQGNTYEPTAR